MEKEEQENQIIPKIEAVWSKYKQKVEPWYNPAYSGNYGAGRRIIK